MPTIRPRRLRQLAAHRTLVRETRIDPRDLVLPVFVKEGIDAPEPVRSMPGVFQHSLKSFATLVDECVEAGIGGVMIFGIPAQRDAVGSAALDPQGVLAAAIQVAHEHAGEQLVVMSDICLDEFTDHGHCGVLAPDGSVDNDATCELYGQMAVIHAQAGVDVVGLSGMMDGQTQVVRRYLDEAGFSNTAILAYSAKYASAYYGPFRDAVESTLRGDRRSYQMDPANRREGLREARLDVAEGADIVMVKPAGSYLDVLSDLVQEVDVPVAAYQVSGEYSMICAAAAQGWIDRNAIVTESLTAIKRAGANHILTYFALDVAGMGSK